MRIQTSRFGEIEVNEASTVTMPEGLIGFQDRYRYVIIRHSTDSPFYWFQSLDDPDLAFVIVDPLLFKPDFQIPMPRALLRAMEAENHQDLSVFVIVTIPKGRPEDMTANLLGPLVVNIKARLARQLVLDDARYSHRHPILPSPEAGDRQARDEKP